MKSNWKKLLSLALVLALMAGFAPGMGLTALAGDETPAYAGLKNTINVVKFDSKDWYLIDYDDSSVTLLTKECVGASKFNPNEPDDNTYSGSMVESFVNSWYTEHISEDAKAAVDGNGMFLLTKDQATALSSDVLKCSKASEAYSNHWWLCSPGSTDSSAERVNGDTGVVNSVSGNVWIKYGVRPALKLDLSKVVFSNNTFALPVPPAASVTSGDTTTEYTTFAEALGAWTDGSTLTLLSDVTTSSTIKVTGTQTLDLNGHGITKTGGDNVIWITGGDLTVNDSDTTTAHYFDVKDGMAVNVNATSGEKSFSGGYITGGTGHSFDSLFGCDGGGVYLDGGSFTLNGGTILGNTNKNDNGGGVEIYSGTMTMNGGTICYNKIGIGLRAGSSEHNRGGGATTANFLMYDGVIANNKTRGILHDWWCYGDDFATFYGGSVINNGDWGISAKYLTIAGGVTVSGNARGVTFASSTATISGSPTISGNTSANLRLNDNQTIDVSNSLSGANIGITMETPGVFTNSTNPAFNDPTKFVSDNSSYAVGKNSSGQLELRVPPAASVTSGDETEEYTTFADALTAWADGSKLTLLSDVTTGSTISVTGTKTLDLNGHGIKATGTGYSVITVGSGANLTLNDSDPNGAHNTQTFTGGYITGGNTAAKHGGGVLINGGSLTMNGGTIKDNNAKNGGGVYVVSGATLHMTGGAIEGNRATENGAGVAVESGATFQMSGGAIRYNACNGDTGGVLLRGEFADFTMSGGSIQYNTGSTIGGIGSWHAQPKFSGAPVVKDNVKGGTVRNTGTGYILEGGTPCNAYNVGSVIAIVGALQDGAEIGMTIPNDGFGVFTGSTDTSFNDPTKFTSDNADYAVFQNTSGQLELRVPPAASVTSGGTPIEYADFATALNNWTDNSTLTLLADVTTITINFSGTKTLDLNGHSLTGNGNGTVIKVNGGSLTVNGKNGTITGGKAGEGGAFFITSNGKVTLNDCTLKGNEATNVGDAFFIQSSGGGGSAIINNCTIIGRGKDKGAALWLQGHNNPDTSFTMNGGSISNFKIGVWVQGKTDLGTSMFTMNGGTISDNLIGVKNEGPNSKVIVSGDAIISNNDEKNLELNDGIKVTVNSALGKNAKIGIYMGNSGVFTKSTTTDYNDATKFTSDNAGYAVGKNTDGQLLLGAPVTVTFDTKGGSAVDAQTVASGSLVTEPAAPTKTNDTFARWYADEGYTNAWDFAVDIVSSDTTLCAQWTSKPVHTVSGTVKQGGAAVSGVDVRLVQGTSVIAVTATNTAGEFSVSASDGIYNIVAVKDGKTKTELVTLNANQQVDITMPTENVNSTLTVTGSEIKNVMVGGLGELAEANSKAGQTVTVTMTVVEKEDAANKTHIETVAAQEHPNQSLDCLEIIIEKTVDSAKTTMESTNKVLEIVVPYRFTGKENVEVYRYHDSAAKLNRLDSKPNDSYTDGTYYPDETNGLIYIYADKFSTYAIGYTQCYNINGPISYGSYTGTVMVSLLEGETVKYTTTANLSSGDGAYSFTHVMKGTYTLRAVWSEGGKETALEQELNVCTTD